MPLSNSEKYLKVTAGLAPKVTPTMAHSVSQFRKELLRQETDEGLFRETDIPPSLMNKRARDMESTPAGYVTSTSLRKSANLGGNSSDFTGAGGFRGSNDTFRQAPNIYSPLWLNSNLNLPRDRATVNAWSRAFFALNGMVKNAISLHATYPISKLNITCKDPYIGRFFEEMSEELELLNVCTQIAQEFWLLGEAAIYADYNANSGKWSDLIIQNPDYVIIEGNKNPNMSLRPDETLKRICTSNRPADIQQRMNLDPNIIEYVRKGQNIPLNPFNASYIANKTSPYDLRGTGLLVGVFRNLMLFDKIREAKFIQADNMINPLTLVTVGDAEYKPTPVDLEHWRNIIEEAQYDPDFKIITHQAVDVKKIGNQGAILDTSADITQIIKELYTGLMVPSVLMDGGADTTYANGGVALDVLRQRYMGFRVMMRNWLRKKIFAPIAKANDFFEWKDKEKILIVPDVEWNHMSLFDVDSYITQISGLATAENPHVSVQTLHRSLGLSYEEERRKIKEEMINNAIAEKEKIALSKMSLAELRALTPTSEINEPAEEPVPGEEGGLPGEEAGGGGMDLGADLGADLGGGAGGGGEEAPL